MSHAKINLRNFPLFSIGKEINIELFAGGGVSAGASKNFFNIAINHNLKETYWISKR